MEDTPQPNDTHAGFTISGVFDTSESHLKVVAASKSISSGMKYVVWVYNTHTGGFVHGYYSTDQSDHIEAIEDKIDLYSTD